MTFNTVISNGDVVTERGTQPLDVAINEGRIVGIRAEKNAEPIRELLEHSDEQAWVLSSVDLGINPASHPLSGSDFYSWEMEGLVTLTTGGNVWAGGDVVSDAGLVFHLAGADLIINGRPLIEQGELMADQQALKH